MLIELFGRNFGPFRDEFRLSMLATDIDPGDERGVVEVPIEGDDEPLRLLRCAAIYGPNASGKSRLLDAAFSLGFLSALSAEFSSNDQLPPYQPFLLDEHSSTKPVMLGVRAVLDRCVYEYVVEFERTRFVVERLARLGPDGESMLFERRGQDVSGPWTAHKQFALLAVSFRPNALLLSLADRLAPDLGRGWAVKLSKLLGYCNFANVSPWFPTGERAAERAADRASGFGPWLDHWLRAADTGVVGFETRKATLAADPGAPRAVGFSRQRHSSGFELSLVHSGPRGRVKLDYHQESFGTQKVVELAPYVYDLTHGDENRAYFIDEIGASVHPVLLESLIRHFNCETPAEQVRGQLIFATHETSILDGEARSAPLRRDQIYLTEKGPDGASRLYSLAEFKERNNLNLRKRYLQGRYGALPSPGPFGA